MGVTSPVVMGITEVLAGTPYHLMVVPYKQTDDPLTPVRYILETGAADGIILSRTQPDDARVSLLLDHGLPFATHGRTAMGVSHPFHDFDNHAFAFESVRRLADRGRRRIALLPPPPDMTYHRHLREGLIDGLRPSAWRKRASAPSTPTRPCPPSAMPATPSSQGRRRRMASSRRRPPAPRRWSPASTLPASRSARTSTWSARSRMTFWAGCAPASSPFARISASPAVNSPVPCSPTSMASSPAACKPSVPPEPEASRGCSHPTRKRAAETATL